MLSKSSISMAMNYPGSSRTQASFTKLDRILSPQQPFIHTGWFYPAPPAAIIISISSLARRRRLLWVLICDALLEKVLPWARIASWHTWTWECVVFGWVYMGVGTDSGAWAASWLTVVCGRRARRTLFGRNGEGQWMSCRYHHNCTRFTAHVSSRLISSLVSAMALLSIIR